MTSIDPKVIRELRALGSPTFLADLIDLYLREAVQHVARLRQSLSDRDAAALERTAHTLKGSSGNLGAGTLSRLAADLQSLAKTMDWEKSAELVTRIEAEYVAVRGELDVEKSR